MPDPRRAAAVLLAAAALAFGAAGAPGPAAAKPLQPGVPKVITRSGAWVLGYMVQENGMALCFAGGADASRQSFEYMSANTGSAMFRLRIDAFAEIDRSKLMAVKLKVDDREPLVLAGRVLDGGLAVLPVDPDSEVKRGFVRSLGEGVALTVLDLSDRAFAVIPLDGARRALAAYGACLRRLPAPSAELKAKVAEEEAQARRAVEEMRRSGQLPPVPAQ